MSLFRAAAKANVPTDGAMNPRPLIAVPGPHGVRDNHNWRGPGNNSLLGYLFAGAAQAQEDAAYARLHQGTVGPGVSVLDVGTEYIPDPASGRLVMTSQGKVKVLDSEYFADLAASENESREYVRKLAETLFVSDEILARLGGVSVFNAAKAGGTCDGMPAQLQPATCLPSILWYLSPASESYSLGVAKMVYIVKNHPGCRGFICTPGRGAGTAGPDTKSSHPRSGQDALAKAIA